MEGELRKRSSHIGRYQRHRALLTPTGIELVRVKGSDDGPPIEPHNNSNHFVPINDNTVVSDITEESVRGNYGSLHKDQYVFKLGQALPSSSPVRARAASTSATSASTSTTGVTNEHVFSCSTREEAEKWKQAIETAVAKLRTPLAAAAPLPSVASGNEAALAAARGNAKVKDAKQKQIREQLKYQASVTIPASAIRAATAAAAAEKTPTGAITNPGMTSHLNVIHKAKWKEVVVTNGLRILAEVGLTREAPCLRVSCRLNASPERAFRLLHDYTKRSLWDSMTESAIVVSQDEDGHLRTMHCKLRGTTVHGLPVSPRDYIVDSTWRRDDDGSYIILETGNKTVGRHEKRYVRAQFYALGVTLSPAADGTDNVCWLQMAVHADPGGWLAKMPLAWGQQWLGQYMLTVVGLQEVLDEANFRAVDFNQLQRGESEEDEDEKHLTASTAPVQATTGNTVDIDTITKQQFPGNLEMNRYVFNCTAPWKLRSSTYLHDKVKYITNTAMFNLMAMDLFEFQNGKMEHITENFPQGTAGRYVAMKDMPFLFVIQFQVPPNYSLVCYFQAKPGAMDPEGKFFKLFDTFARGTDSERDNRFKFIPRVVKGNFVVRNAVGQVPALLGNKLVTTYHSGSNYFEIDVDVGSSSVAGGILSVCKSYASLLSIDMAFLLEAHTDEELPEVLIGALSFQELSLGMAQKV